MRNYDLTLILSPSLSPEQANDVTQLLISSVQEDGGILGDQKLLENRPLLAPIGKAKEGHLAALTFTMNEEKLQNLEKKCKEHEQILRFMLMKQPRKVYKQKNKMTLKAITPGDRIRAPQESSTTTQTEHKKEEKIDLKDIDEKLEEIFKEPL